MVYDLILDPHIHLLPLSTVVTLCPRIIAFFVIAAAMGAIVRATNIVELVDWGRRAVDVKS